MAPSVSVSVDVDAPPERVYDLVSDLPRMGEWSPECVRCDWVGGATGPAPGARFKGRNRRGIYRWSTNGEVVDVEPGRGLAFDVSFLGLPVARWRYTIEPLGDGRSRVTETWEERRGRLMKVIGAAGTGVRDRETHNTAGMEETLQRIKLAAEAG
jgi:uncharacterized protein YndB with AHSA1/START domain